GAGRMHAQVQGVSRANAQPVGRPLPEGDGPDIGWNGGGWAGHGDAGEAAQDEERADEADAHLASHAFIIAIHPLPFQTRRPRWREPTAGDGEPGRVSFRTSP